MNLWALWLVLEISSARNNVMTVPTKKEEIANCIFISTYWASALRMDAQGSQKLLFIERMPQFLWIHSREEYLKAQGGSILNIKVFHCLPSLSRILLLSKFIYVGFISLVLDWYHSLLIPTLDHKGVSVGAKSKVSQDWARSEELYNKQELFLVHTWPLLICT